MGLKRGRNGLSRRGFMKILGGLGVTAWVPAGFMRYGKAWAQAKEPGVPLPDEKVEETLKRLFGARSLVAGDGKLKLEVPLIAEDGGNVPVTVEANFPMTPQQYVRNLYLISDKNRRPLLAKFSFTPEAGKAYVATNVRLAMTTDVRAIAELNDGSLFMAKREVRVTISGCDVPPSD